MKRSHTWRAAECLFLLVGLVLLDYYIWEQASTGIYQSYESWTFDRELSGQNGSVVDFVADQFHLGRSVEKTNASGRSLSETPALAQPKPAPAATRLADEELIGRLEIPRVGVRAIVREGTDSRTLERAIGHVPYTALPGSTGNVAIAAHRDTFFRGLSRIRQNDLITFDTLKGKYQYQVESMRIVSPKDVSVIAPTANAELTMITCYPFYYVGSAPQRFIVKAKQIDAGTDASHEAKAGAPRRPVRAKRAT